MNENVLNKKSTDYLAVKFFFIKKHILLIVLNDCKIIKPPSPVQAKVQTILLFKLYYETS